MKKNSFPYKDAKCVNRFCLIDWSLLFQIANATEVEISWEIVFPWHSNDRFILVCDEKGSNKSTVRVFFVWYSVGLRVACLSLRLLLVNWQKIDISSRNNFKWKKIFLKIPS